MALGPDPNAGLKHYEVILTQQVTKNFRRMVAARDEKEALEKVKDRPDLLNNPAQWHQVAVGDVQVDNIKLHGDCGKRTGRPVFSS